MMPAKTRRQPTHCIPLRLLPAVPHRITHLFHYIPNTIYIYRAFLVQAHSCCPPFRIALLYTHVYAHAHGCMHAYMNTNFACYIQTSLSLSIHT
jgi:hypothetical protein